MMNGAFGFRSKHKIWLGESTFLPEESLSGMKIILLSSGCYSKIIIHWIGLNNINVFLIVLEARSPRPGC